MQRTFCDIAENQRGELRVGIAYTRGRAILPGILEAFAGVYPNVRAILTEERNHCLLYTSGMATALYLNQHYACKPVYLVGTQAFRRELLSYGIPLVEEGEMCIRDRA